MKFEPGTALAPPTDKQIKWFEKAYRVTLPREYVATLKAGNGAVPLMNAFDEGGRGRMIERMLCLLEDSAEDDENGGYDITVIMTEVGTRMVDDEDLIGMNVIPVAELFAGDYLCLDYRKNSKTPSVAVWAHEESDEFEPVLYKVADSWKEFEGMLRKS